LRNLKHVASPQIADLISDPPESKAGDAAFLIMKKILLLIPFLALCLISETCSQTPGSPFEYRFKDGFNGFLKFVYENSIMFPEKSRSINSFGLSVVKVTVSPGATIEQVEIINSIDPAIDEMLSKLLKKSSGLWIKNDTILKSQNFFLQFAFVYFEVQKDFLDNSALPTYKMFVEPVVLTTSQVSSNSKNRIRDDDFLIKQSAGMIGKGDFTNALLPVNELIKRYPYSREFYQLRIVICKNLGDTVMIQKDIKKMNDFADGLPLDDLFN